MDKKNILPHKLLPLTILIILVATLSPVNGKMLGNYLDKVAHFILFAGLSVNIAYCYFPIKKRNLAFLLAVGLAVLTEVLQQYVPGRNLEIVDGIADILGIIAGFLFFKFKA